MILVTGATGHLGKAAIGYLIKKGISPRDISALVRDEQKAADLKDTGAVLKKGDYSDYSSLTEAFKGADKLLFISGNDLFNRVQQHDNVVRAAREANVKHIIYTSAERKNETETSPIALLAQAHIKTEQLLKASGIAYTILRNNIYAEYIPVFAGDKVLETGAIYFPSGEGKVSYLLRTEIAEIAANVLATPGHENKTYSISSDHSYSFGDIAGIISGVTNKKISFISPSPEEYVKTLSAAGVPLEYAHAFAGFGEAIRQNEFDARSNDTETLLGRKPAPLSQYLEQVYSPAV